MNKTKKIKVCIAILIFIAVMLFSFIVFAKNNNSINTAPVASLSSINTTNKSEIVIFTDYTGQKLSDLQSKVTNLKTDLNGNANINIVNDTEVLGTGSKTEYQTKYVTVQQVYYSTPPSTLGYNEGQMSGTLNKVGNYTTSTNSYWNAEYSFPISTGLSMYLDINDPRLMGSADGLFPPTMGYSSGGATGTYVRTGIGGTPVYGDKTNADGTVTHNALIGCNAYASYSGTATHPGYWQTLTTYTQTFAGTIAGNVTINYSKLGVDTNKISNMSFQSSSKKYAVFLTDSNTTDFSSDFGNYFPFGDLSTSFKQYLQQNSFTMYSIMNVSMLDTNVNSTTGKQPYTIRQLLSSSPTTTSNNYCNDVDSCFQKIKDEISNTHIVGDVTYICTDEAIQYTKSYSDYENDPKCNERWKYVQDPSIFNPNDGLCDFNNMFIDNPITQFDKSGKYTITYQAKDDPTSRLNMIGFNKWSTGENQLTIIVHHRPVADFTTSINHSTLAANISNTSYDKDHLNEVGKGIVASNWKWKSDESLTWTDGMPPTALQMSKTYDLGLQVQDKEGAWSHWAIKTFTVGQNTKPNAKFQINNIMCKGSINNIEVQDSDPDSDPISEYHWTIINKATNTVVPGFNNISTTPNLSTLDIGMYQIKHWVKDNPQWGLPLASDEYTQDLNILENINLSAKIGTSISNLDIKTTAKQGQQILFSINTTGYVKFLTVYFPNEITSLDDNLPIKKTILEEENHTEQIYYKLPLKVPLTLDKNNVQISPTYKIWVTATKSDGTTTSAYVYLDINGSILDGFRTCTINDNP